MDRKDIKSSNGFFSRIKYVKNIEIYIAVILALVLLLIYVGGNDGKLSGTSAMTNEEKRLAQTLSAIKGAGKVQVMITYEGDETVSSNIDGNTEKLAKIKGVVVVAEGAKDIFVKLELQRATTHALLLKNSQVEVFEMK